MGSFQLTLDKLVFEHVFRQRFHFAKIYPDMRKLTLRDPCAQS
jgi:hypothetical protein